MIYLHQLTTERFPPISGVLFSRNFADAKLRENKTLTKISDFTVHINSTLVLQNLDLSIFENTVDPDQLVMIPSDQDPHCLPLCMLITQMWKVNGIKISEEYST